VLAHGADRDCAVSSIPWEQPLWQTRLIRPIAKLIVRGELAQAGQHFPDHFHWQGWIDLQRQRLTPSSAIAPTLLQQADAMEPLLLDVPTALAPGIQNDLGGVQVSNRQVFVQASPAAFDAHRSRLPDWTAQ